MSSRIDKIMPFALPLVLLSLAGFYYLVSPVALNYPVQCVWRVLTGTQCPACGFQRAFHALMHGHLWEALSYNFFFVISVPLAVAAVIAEWYNWHHKFDGLRTIIHHRYVLTSYVILYFLWWILRNILNI